MSNEQENALYVAVQVQDDSVVRDSLEGGPWNAQDGCEIYFNVIPQDGTAAPLQYVLWGDNRYIYFKGELQGPLENAEVEAVWSQDAYQFEWRIEIRSGGENEASLQDERIKGFDITLWDRDEDGSRSWVAWGPGNPKNNSLDRVGMVVLGGKSVRPNLVVEIEKVETPPIIDGDVSDWSQVKWIRLAQGAPNMPLGRPLWSQLQNDGASEPKRTAGTDEDLSGSFALQWDEEWIYLAAQVTDNVHDVTGGNQEEWWFKDAVSLFLDIPLDGDGDTWTKGDHSFSFVADPIYPDYGKWWRNGNPRGKHAPTGTQLVAQLDQDGDYVLEAAIPMSALMEATPQWRPPFEERIVGFMVVVTDPDGGENPFGGQLMYGGVDDNDANWARLRFRPAKMAVSPHFEFPGGSVSETAIGKLKGKIKWEDMEEGTRLGRVRIHSLTSVGFWAEVRTDSQGVYEVELPVGEYQVKAGYRHEKESIETEVQSGRITQVQEMFFPTPPMGLVVEAGQGKIVKAGTGKMVPAGAGLREGGWQNFGVVDGLSDRRVWSVFEDSLGQLWLGTDGGISRYDGHSFTNYTTEDGLPSNRVRSIYEDRSGQLWIGTDGGGVSRYDGQTFTNFTTDDGLVHNHITSVCQDREGYLWFGTLGGGVSRYDGQTFTNFTIEDGLAHNVVGSIYEDRSGQMWFGTNGGGISRYDGQTFTRFTTRDGLAHNGVWAIAKDEEGNLWFGTSSGGNLWFGTDGGGVSRYDGETFTTFTTDDGLASNTAISILEDRSGQLWFGTDGGGVSRYDGETFTAFTTDDGLPSNFVISILEDRSGQLWFGSVGGLSRYDGETFTNFNTKDNRLGNWVVSILEDRLGQLWFGTGDGLHRYDGREWTTFTTEDGLAHNVVNTIYEDRSGQLWIGTQYAGLSRYDGEAFTSFSRQDGSRWDVRCLLEDRSGQLWIGAQGGVSRYGGETFTNFNTKDNRLGHWVVSILEDHLGQLWFGTWGDGLHRYDGREWTTFTTEDGLAGNSVNSIFEDDSGHLWIGCTEGLSRYNGETFTNFTTFTTSDGLPANDVFSISEEDSGQLLIGCRGGLSRYDGVLFQNLVKRDGLISNSINGILQDKHGDVWIATSDGVTRYRTNHVRPPIHFTNVIADRVYGSVAQVSLPSSQEFVTFEFVGISYKTRPGQMAYMYRLEGHDSDWKVTREQRLTYTDLSVGEYIFQVKAVDRDLDYSEKPATVKVTVHPPYGLIALWSGLGFSLLGLVLASGYGIKRNRERNRVQQERLELQEKLNQELEAELQTAHDMQMGLMPTESPKIKGLDITGRCIPANHVGGDFFQYFPISENRLAISLADVTGHAMEAAVPVMMFSGILDTQMETGDKLEDLFPKLNRSLCRNLADRRTYVCFTMGELDTATKKFRLSNGGCPYPYHYKASSGVIIELQVDAYPLGVRVETTYPVIETQLEPGDRIVFCSDGIIEAENSERELFGFERTAETIRNGCDQNLIAPQLLDYLINEVKQFSGETPQGDDQTIVVLQVEP